MNTIKCEYCKHFFSEYMGKIDGMGVGLRKCKKLDLDGKGPELACNVRQFHCQGKWFEAKKI